MMPMSTTIARGLLECGDLNGELGVWRPAGDIIWTRPCESGAEDALAGPVAAACAAAALHNGY